VLLDKLLDLLEVEGILGLIMSSIGTVEGTVLTKLDLN
jgi:hypothetical protein